MQNIITQRCPKCNNNQNFSKYGKDKSGNQKYLCKVCNHQFAPMSKPVIRGKKYPPCPKCGKASFIHHDYDDYTNYRCGDKKCNHSFFTPKPTVKLPPSMSSLVGKHDFKRMRQSVFLIFTALTMSFIGKSSSRNIALILKMLYNIKVSHVTIADWCKKFAPLLDNIAVKLIPSMNFHSDEWHADETVVKINGVKHYIWFIIDSETRFVLGFHLSPHRDSPQAHTILNHAKNGLVIPTALSATAILLTMSLLSVFSPMLITFASNLSMMTFLIISLNLFTANSRLGTRSSAASTPSTPPIPLSLLLSSFSTSFVLTWVSTVLLPLRLPVLTMTLFSSNCSILLPNFYSLFVSTFSSFLNRALYAIYKYFV